MKIGILTYHRTLNYGACLQAVATRIVLQKLGHEVYYVDYWPRYHQDKYSLFSFHQMCSKGVKKAFLYIKDFIEKFPQKKERIGNFKSFFSIYIDPFCKPMTEHFDAVIYGSDQIWRKQSSLNAYNPVYFGKNEIDAKRHIAYAASMGVLPQNEADLNIIKEYLSHLTKISVREENLMALLKENGFPNVVRTLDPTLLLDKNDWDKVFADEENDFSREKYVLFYDLLYGSFERKEIEKFAKSKGMSVKVISGYARHSASDVYSTGAPQLFLSLIRNAEFVFTSSFHGLVFSIIYNKNFYASFRENGDRARSLLDSLNIKEKMLKPKQEIPITYDAINYDDVGNRLRLMREKSLLFLESMDK